MSNSFLQQCFGMRDRVALITGAAGGIGFAIAQSLGHAGARIVINDLSAEACAEAVAKLAAEGIEARAASFDVADEATVQASRKALRDAGWGVDVLVSNAGNQNRKPLVEMSREEWGRIMAVHLDGAFNCTRTFLPDMCERGYGRIVMMSSSSAVATMPGIGAYSTAKSGLLALSRAIAVEYARQGVTSNAVVPGFIRTAFTVGLQQRAGFDDVIDQSVPCGRWGSPEEVAAAVLFLVSPAAAFVNGHALTVDGGLLARL